MKNEVTIAGGQILGDEYSDHVIKVCVTLSGSFVSCLYLHAESQRDYLARKVNSLMPVLLLAHNSYSSSVHSTFLKSDQWLSKSTHMMHGIRGAINFRNIYALGQPMLKVINEVVRRVQDAHLGV